MRVFFLQITLDTKNILVEVTSSVNLKSCKEVLDALIRETAKLQLYAEDDKKSSEEDFKCNMVIQQVRVVDKEGHLRVVYPAHPDLQFDDLRIIHEAKKA